MNKYLELFRLQNAVIGLAGFLITAYVAAGDLFFDSWQNILIGCAVVVLFIAGGNSLNDYIDRDIDKKAHPERPIPSGRLEPKQALYLGLGCLVASIAVSLLFCDYVPILIVVVACALMFLYEFSFKKLPFVGNVTIAVLTGMVFLLGNAAVCDINMKCSILAALATLVSVGRELTKDIEDVEGDEGRTTLPMVIGLKNSGIVAAFFYIAGPVLSIVPMIENYFNPLFYFVISADIIFVYCAFILFKNPHLSQKMAKLAMVFALIAFAIGTPNIL